jgi:hypothetical protein
VFSRSKASPAAESIFSISSSAIRRLLASATSRASPLPSMPIIGATWSRVVRMPAAASASSQLSMRAPTVSTSVPSRSNAMPAGAGSLSGRCGMGAPAAAWPEPVA